MTLIELMIGLGIVAMLVLASAPSFTSYMQNSQIRNAAESIENALSVAKAEAVQRNTNVGFTLSAANNSSWTVGCVVSSANCPATIQARSNAEGSNNVVVAATDSTIVFNGLGRVTTALVATPATFAVSNSTGTCKASGGTMRCLSVTVSKAGQIRMCDPAVTTTTDPRAC